MGMYNYVKPDAIQTFHTLFKAESDRSFSPKSKVGI